MFNLAYYGRIPDVDNLYVQERIVMYDMLIKTKEKEYQEYQKASQKR